MSRTRSLDAQIAALTDEIVQISARVAPRFAKACVGLNPFVPHSARILPLLQPALDSGDLQAAQDLLRCYVQIHNLQTQRLEWWQHDPESYAAVVSPEEPAYMQSQEDEDAAEVAAVLRLSPEEAAKRWPSE